MNFFSMRDDFKSNEKRNNSTLRASAIKERECKHDDFAFQMSKLINGSKLLTQKYEFQELELK